MREISMKPFFPPIILDFPIQTYLHNRKEKPFPFLFCKWLVQYLLSSISHQIHLDLIQSRNVTIILINLYISINQ